MMKRIIGLTFLCVLGYASIAQKLYGLISDSLTNTPIPYAHIYSSDLKHGTYSNIDGEFEISLPNPSGHLEISHLSYAKKQITVGVNNHLNIKLNANVLRLDEITIKPLDAYEILLKAFKYSRKMKSENIRAKAFYRQITKHVDEYTEIQEVFYDLNISNRGVEKWSINQGRFAQKKMQKEHKYFRPKNFSVLTTSLMIYKKNIRDVIIPVSPHIKDYYILNILSVSDNGVIEIECKLKDGIKKPAIEGSIFVQSNTMELLKMKGSVNHSLGLSLDDPQLLLEEVKYYVDISFSNNNKTIPSLNYIEVVCKFKYGKKGTRLKDVLIKASLYVYEYSTKTGKENYSKTNIKQDDLHLIQNMEYDIEFWKKNSSIVKRTPIEDHIIKSFEEGNSFGNIFE